MRKFFLAAILATILVLALSMGVGADNVVSCCH
jgi:hypothetical protein